jgi:N-acetylglucosamine PTS system EIICBA or EIICB component
MIRLNFAPVQQLGRALMLPIAVLPVAGLLLRLGQDDLLNIAFMAAAGQAIFDNLGLLFAIGIAVGFADENHGAAGLAGAVGFLVATKGAEALVLIPPAIVGDLAIHAFKAKAIATISVPCGILSGIVAGALYNRFKDIKLPEYLAFFGGRRFVPIATGCAGLLLAAAFGYGFPAVEQGLDVLSRSVLNSGSAGLFIYGVLNRLLLVTGLHHILNNIAWFVLGDFNGTTGDLKRFFAGDPSAGAFMSGFFPVMMFGLPAACLAMYRTAKPARRAAVAGMLLSMALTSFLTGVTEPIEFSFMFAAPALYAIHAVLTGLAMVAMHLLDVKLGFGFSAGLFDYVLNYGKATHPLLLLPIGLAYFAIYYGVFRYAITALNLKTLGREDDDVATPARSALPAERGRAFAQALGGAGNLTHIDACTTRLRLEVIDSAAIDEPALRSLGARGVLRPSKTTVQVVLGPIADMVAGEIRAALASPALAPDDTERLLAALGGAGNLREVEARSTRLRVTLGDGGKIDAAALQGIARRGMVRASPDCLHLLIGAEAEALAAGLRRAVA